MVIYDLGSIADWISSIGTLCAVMVALYLANRERKPRAKVTSSFLHLIYDSGPEKEPSAVVANIVNIGLVPIHLKECAIRVGKNKRMVFLEGDHIVNKLLSPGEAYSHKLRYEPIREHFLRENINKCKTDIYFEDGSGKKYKSKIILRV